MCTVHIAENNDLQPWECTDAQADMRCGIISHDIFFSDYITNVSEI